MSGVQAIVERAEELYRDIKLAHVVEWKARTGGLALGFLPIWAPRELLWSQGVLPVGIMGGGEDVEIIKGDAFYQSYICHLPRSTIELALNGSLDCLDGMLFPAICDVIRNLSGIWKLRFAGKLARYLDVPQDFDPEIGGVFLRHEFEELSRELAARGAKPYRASELTRCIGLYNENRARIQALYELRKREPWKVPTWELYLLLRAGLVLPVEEHSALLDRYREAVELDTTRKPMDQARVVLVGSFCEQPPLGLIKTLERSGCYIVDDDFVQVGRWFQHAVPLDGDPLEQLVRAYLADAIPSPTRYDEHDTKSAEILGRVDDSAAEGVIFCAPSFCDPALLDQPMTVRALDERGVPWTSFKYSENTGQFQVIREQAGTFADSIKLFSGAGSP
jgi:benzoyl-CoA reductase subunit C